MANTADMPPGKNWVCLGVITGASGIKGEVKIKSFTEDPQDLGDYGPVTAPRLGKAFKVKVLRAAKGGVVARIEGVADRNAAEVLKGEQLFVCRSALPALPDDETFYHADLIGLAVEDGSGLKLGKVKAVYDFGAGDMLEVALEAGIKEKVVMIPFTKARVPLVDIAGGRLQVVISDDAPEESPEEADRG
jgi:16S rRNA processing protein RimM